MPSSDAIHLLKEHACGAERRQQPRIPVNWRTAIMIKNQNDTVRVFGRTRDASISGICIECEQTIITLAPVIVVIELPAKMAHHPPNIIQVSAELKSCILANDKYRLGMLITEFHGNSHQEIRKHIRPVYQPGE